MQQINIWQYWQVRTARSPVVDWSCTGVTASIILILVVSAAVVVRAQYHKPQRDLAIRPRVGNHPRTVMNLVAVAGWFLSYSTGSNSAVALSAAGYPPAITICPVWLPFSLTVLKLSMVLKRRRLPSRTFAG